MDEAGHGSDYWREKATKDATVLRAAISEAEAGGRGRDVTEVEADLVRELRARGGFMSPTDVRIIALGICQPDWFSSHPGQLEDMLSTQADDEARVEEQQERTSERLGDVMDRCRGVRHYSVAAVRTMDGFAYKVGIEPWSPRLADKVRRKTAPTPVAVTPLEPHLRRQA